MANKNTEYVLEVEDLSVEFHTPSGVVHAVSHASFKLRQGETLGIVGESGSGKSVTANSIMRLLPDTARVTGKILFKGQDILKMKTKDFNKIRGKEISMIFQDPMTSLNPLYTVGNQLEEVLKLHMGLKGEAATKRAIELLDMVSIPQPETRVTQYPHEFSGGMRQRVMIAMALACDPTILIADEPTTALDVTIQAQILELINRLKKERNLSIIFITHDLGVVANMADRIAVMYAGKIVEYGTAEEVFYEPAHPYTWALLSSMPDLETKEKLEAIPGTPPNMIYPPKGDAFAERNRYALKIDFEEQPPIFPITDTHWAATWLLHPNAPKMDPPKTVTDRIKKMKARVGGGANA